MIFEPFPQAGYLDQTAHWLVGALLTLLWIYFGVIWWLAITITMTIAFIREMIQHPWRVPPGSRTDLLFWFIGCITGCLIG